MRKDQIESVRARIKTLEAELSALRFDETTFEWDRDERIDGQSTDLYNTQNDQSPMMVKTFVKCYKVYINRNKTAPAPPKAVLNHGHSRVPSQFCISRQLSTRAVSPPYSGEMRESSSSKQALPT
jgi:hypothetical protein